MKHILGLLVWVLCCYGNGLAQDQVVFSQLVTHKDSAVVLQTVNRLDGSHKLVRTNLQGDTQHVIILDTLVHHGGGNPISDVQVQFINKYHGYVYGNVVGYAIYPFILKTIDGGKTWKPILIETEMVPNRSLLGFHMFDFELGMAIMGTIDEFTYFITTNGGETWVEKQYKE